MIFRQLFEPLSSTCTYLLGREETGQAVLIDPVMQALKLPYPKFIDYAVPGNKQCGVCPEDLPEKLKEYCELMQFTPQG